LQRRAVNNKHPRPKIPENNEHHIPRENKIKMASITPNPLPQRDRSRSASRTRLPSRPTTPLRPSSRSSLRNSQNATTAAPHNPLDALESQFAEFSDGMADLEANFMHLQLMHESLARFSESFAAFLYGMNMNAFCVDFPEGPVPESFRRAQLNQPHSLTSQNLGGYGGGMKASDDVEATFLYATTF
jgi:DASH complex subunit DAM1